ncbi:MAG: efflux RND transporter permease subunit [Marinicaulis sp.]|nr:efflux RND transporter permease subunit [Marinicaulis sp.]
MNFLIDAAFARSRVVITALIALILFGISAYRNIPREADPDIPAPFVMVMLPLPGVSPEDAERLLIRPTELELQKVEGLVQMDSLAFDGVAQIAIEFEVTIDIDQAVLDVREAVDRAKSEYPTDAEEPLVQEFNVQNQFPILTTILYGPAPERTKFDLARKLEDRLASAPGVLEAKLTGSREELLEIIVRPETLEAYGITEIEVINAVSANNRLITAGAIRSSGGRFTVKSPGLVKGAEDLGSIVIRAGPDGEVTIADIAEVRRTFKDRSGYALFNGEPAIGIELSKRAEANIVETIEAAREIVLEESKFWPASVQYEFIGDQSVFVRDSLKSLTSSVVTAVLLVMIVVVAALGLRSGLMVGIAIPSTFLIGFFLISSFGYTLNMMVMFGLVLSVGMLVDGAIVIVEYADRRMAEGANRKAAFSEASKRMFWPVVTSTATTLAAFTPFLFWQSLPGEFMKYLPITLIFVLLSSLTVALIFLPVSGSMLATPDWLKRKFKTKGKTDGPKRSHVDDSDPLTGSGFVGSYSRVLARLIKRPILVMSVSIGVMWVCLATFNAVSPDVEFFIRNDDDQINVLVLGRGNLSEDQKLEIAKTVSARIEDHPAIKNSYLQTGLELSRDNNLPPETIAKITVSLNYYSEREHSRIVTEQLRDRVQGVPGVLVEVRQREGGPPVGKDAQVEISGPSFDAMMAAAQKTRNFLESSKSTINGAEVPTYMDIEDTMPLPGIEWSMEVDRALAGRYGLSVQQAGAVLQFVTDGLLIDKYRPDDSEDEIDIRIRYPEESRNISALDTVRLQTPAGPVPISNFVTREAKPQVDRITRRNGNRIIELKANGYTRLSGHEVSQDKAISNLRTWLESDALGEDVTWIMRGADEETADAAAFFQSAMAAAMFMIAMILLLEFNSFYHSILTLSAVVFSVFGVLFGIAVSGQYFSIIMTGVGIVALAGIVVNNNIVLIDTYQNLRRKGLAVEDAVVRTAAQRLRPVLLTTATTILGLLPMVFELNVNYATGVVGFGSSVSDWWVLLSSAVVYGLAFSTMLTLVLTPVLLAAPTVIRKQIPTAITKIKGRFTGSQAPKSLGNLSPGSADYKRAAE